MGIIQLRLFPEKQCPKCKQSKPPECFSPQKASRDGLSSYCKACNAERARNYNKNKPRSPKPPRSKMSREEQNRRNAARRRVRYAQNKETFRESERRWRARHPETRSVRANRYWARKQAAEGDYTPEEWAALCEKYDNHCLACGVKTKVHADHIVPLSKGGSNWISNIQPLCKPCNTSKKDKEIDYRPLWEQRNVT